MTKSILIPVDFTDVNKPKVKIADAWAQKTGSRLYFIHAVPYVRRYYLPAADKAFDITEEQEIIDEYQKKLDGFVDFLDVESPHEQVIMNGKPALQILALQEELDAQMIMMSAHDHSVLDRILGSTTDYVLHHSKCPVYVYKDRTEQFENTILVPLEMSEVEAQVIYAADDWAQHTDSKLVFLHTVNPKEQYLFSDIEQTFSSEQEGVVREAQQSLEAFIHNCDISSSYRCVIRIGKPYLEILDEAVEINARLIVMSAHDHTILGRLIMGSTTDYVLQHSRCPLFVYKLVGK